MVSSDDMRKKFYTESGSNALFKRLETLIKLYEQSIEYPFSRPMLGFIPLSIKSKEGHENMINELRQILGLQKVIITDDDHGRKVQIEVC